jgi:nitrous oxide reductase
MRATAPSAPIRKGRRYLLESCAIMAGLAALACGGPALAQVAGTGQAVTGPGLSIPTISPPGPGATTGVRYNGRSDDHQLDPD